MPVRQYTPNRSANHVQLVDELAAEWSKATSNAAEPVILEETAPRGGATHVYVVWGQWSQLGREERGEIIMDAAEKVKSQTDVQRITIAMGLTPDEADRFGIKWR